MRLWWQHAAHQYLFKHDLPAGLKTTVHVIRRAYETGRQVTADFKASLPILFDKLLPKWNYRAIPT